jgi:hypothetical protein
MNKILRLATLTLSLLVMNSSNLTAQSNERLGAYADFVFKQPDANDRQNRASGFYLLKLPHNRKLTTLVNEGIIIARKLDNGWCIVKGTSNALSLYHRQGLAFKANSIWKLLDYQKINSLKGNHHFIIKTNATQRIADFLKSRVRATAIGSGSSLFRVHLTAKELIDDVIPQEGVLYAGLESQGPMTESRVLDLNLGPNAVNKIHHHFPDLSGHGMTLSIQELAYDPNDLDLLQRNIPSPLADTQVDNHATDMATIAAGAGNTFVTGRGVASKASITSSSFAEVLPDRDEDYISFNTWVQNHSYGTEIESFYGALAEAFDKSAHNNPTLLHVFSSGNSGQLVSNSGVYKNIPGYANLTGNFKMSKNTLAIGSVDTIGRAISFSSRGPAHDGRIKPELVTYSMAGSSNSAALVSGVSLLLQQHYKATNGTLPPSALIKALLINSAEDAGPPGIDFITGYGNVNSYRALLGLKNGNYMLGTVAHNEQKNFTLSIPDNARNLKVTLVWNDPAATPNSATALVNDLDLKVSDSNLTTWLPWVLDASASVTALAAPAVRSEDHRNNCEQVLIEDPVTGDYTITIRGYDVPAGNQNFALAYQIDTTGLFEWYFPTSSDNMPYNGETTSYFSWHSTRSEANGVLEYSVDNGISWKVISSSVDLKKGYYRWKAPDITASAMARMKVGGTYYPTEAFTIAYPTSTRVGFNCSDSVMLLWNRIPGASHYQLLSIANEQYLQTVLTTADTAAVLNKNLYPARHYAVQPVFTNGSRPIRSVTFDYTEQGVECFIRSFIATVDPDQGVQLALEVGTTYSIDHVVFERMEPSGAFMSIGSKEPTANRIEFTDHFPQQGLNTHRARITLANGQTIISEEQENFYLTTIPALFLPNPVQQQGQLTIVTRELQSPALFLLRDMQGKDVLRKIIISDRESVDVNFISPGLYIATFAYEGQLYSQRLMIQ